MKLPLSVSFRGMSSSEWIETDIRKRVVKLEEYCRDIMSCRVTVDIPHRHHRGGNRFSLRIDLMVPGEEIAVSRGANLHGSKKDLSEHEWVKQFDVEGMRKDLRLVIREAFDVARRRLQDYARKSRLAIKTHQEVPRGRVVRWTPAGRSGVIETRDGREIYFHQNSVIGAGLSRLRTGADVTFVEEQGDKGPQASTVNVLRPRRPDRLAS